MNEQEQSAATDEDMLDDASNTSDSQNDGDDNVLDEDVVDAATENSQTQNPLAWKLHETGAAQIRYRERHALQIKLRWNRIQQGTNNNIHTNLWSTAGYLHTRKPIRYFFLSFPIANVRGIVEIRNANLQNDCNKHANLVLNINSFFEITGLTLKWH